MASRDDNTVLMLGRLCTSSYCCRSISRARGTPTADTNGTAPADEPPAWQSMQVLPIPTHYCTLLPRVSSGGCLLSAA